MSYIMGGLYCYCIIIRSSNLVSYITTWYVKQEAFVVAVVGTVISITVISFIRGILL